MFNYIMVYHRIVTLVPCAVYARTSLFTCSGNNSLYLLIPSSQYFPLLPSTPLSFLLLKLLQKWCRDLIRWASLVAQMVKRLPAMREIWVQSLGREDPRGEGNGNPLQHSCLENPMDGGA